MSNLEIRQAQESDLPQIRAINAHYILHTSLTFAQSLPPLETYHAKLADLSTRGLPYLVAVSKDASTSEASQEVRGYAYLSPFRGNLTAYAPTVELSLFLHPEHYSEGIGSILLREIIGLLRERRVYHTVNEPTAIPTDDPSSPAPRVAVENMIAVMAVDPDGKENGEALRRWYAKRGFEERGRLSKVGFKRGRWSVLSVPTTSS